MKIFLYKTAIGAFIFFLLFEILIGSRINSLESKIYNLSSKKNIEDVRAKIFKEIKNGTKKENYFSKEERKILSEFIYKVVAELSVNDKNK
jgi:hypothetical protein|tara:strand:- start:13 stop:285 length:273 start_codon:yes stop_codon:yes gene_type:complete